VPIHIRQRQGPAFENVGHGSQFDLVAGIAQAHPVHDHQFRPRFENAPQLGERARFLAIRNVTDRFDGESRREATFLERGVEVVAVHEFHIRKPLRPGALARGVDLGRHQGHPEPFLPREGSRRLGRGTPQTTAGIEHLGNHLAS
jgi:hypothetical protein